jgi:hypothetical protein
MPAMSDPVASPDAIGATRKRTSPNSVPTTGSTRSGRHRPSGGGGGTAAGWDGAAGGVGYGGWLTLTSMSPERGGVQLRT